MYKKKFLDNILPLFAFILLIIFQQKQTNYIKIQDKNYAVDIDEIYLDLSEAKIASDKLKKDILVIIETEFYENKKFKRNNFPKIKLEDYIVCYLDIKNKEIIEKYNIKSVPYFMILDSCGNVKNQGNFKKFSLN